VADTYIRCTVVDLRTLVGHTYVLEEFRRFYSRPVSVGRDPGSDIILDDPEILPHHALLEAASNHRMVRRLEKGPGASRDRHDGHPFVLGPFGIRVVESEDHRGTGAPPPELPVRFGAARGLGKALHGEPAVGEDPMAQEVQRLIQALRSTAGHVHELDDETARWCAAQLDEHFALLSRATAQYAAVVPRRIEYTSSLAYARLRWDSEWSAVERRRSSAEALTYVHRLARWWAGHDAHNEHYLLWYFTKALLRPEFVHWAAEPHGDDVTRALTALTAAHLVSLDEADSPIKPLIALAERGVFTFALPGAATLLYVPTCRGERGVAHCSDQAEAPFLRALAVDPGDHQVRLVYADLLEQHGELARAERLREEASGSVPSEPRIKRVEQLFGDARAVFLPRQARPPEVRLMTASGQPPAGAHLEAGELSFPLAHATWRSR
jgi:uncharacterized protein (TIGR02996 family)